MTRDDQDDAVQRSPKRTAIVWALGFAIVMLGTALIVKSLSIGPTWTMIAMMLPMLILIPMVRSIERAQAACGNFSPALRRYNRRSLIWSFAYVVALTFAIWAYRGLKPEGALLWFIAILPSLPLLFFIYAMGAYLVEEKDEYLRQRAILNALWATGILLAVATFYGFLETFGLVPHQPGWWAVPVWAVGLGIGNLITWKTS